MQVTDVRAAQPSSSRPVAPATALNEHDANADFALAMLRGPAAWLPAGEQPPTAVRGALRTALSSLPVVAALLIVAGSARVHSLRWRDAIAAGGAALGLIVLSLSAFHLLLARQRQPMRPWRATLLSWARPLAVLVVLGTWVAMVRGITTIAIFPLGTFIGSEAAALSAILGSRLAPAQLARASSLSAIHLGGLTAAAVTAALTTGDVRSMALRAMLTLEAVHIAVLFSYSIQRAAIARTERDITAIRHTERSEAWTHLAHWIHDDVCADIRELRMRAALGQVDATTLTSDLDALDDRLRQRQLDNVIRSGSVEAAEILQPYVRRAQNAGVTIVAVPGFEGGSTVLRGSAADLMRRAVAGFTSNAIQAGTTTLAIALDVAADSLVVHVEDNAGGFDLAAAPAGRGLARLGADLGAGNLSSRRTERGTVMSARIILEELG